ncbi:Protein FAM136A [Tupaia chinensis]|uniref:Protein FAM136A n=1 Tax=Tupaia chinensis TaxID=246437 RepID=L9KQD0_TUPCH|nr:Protein FAM136A [Tupaia chinensis]
MEGLVFRCSAGCCEDNQASMWQVHQCLEHRHVPLAQAQALVTNELKFQDCRAQCTMHCNNKAKTHSGSKEPQATLQLDSWESRCVNGHMHLRLAPTEKMKKSLTSKGPVTFGAEGRNIFEKSNGSFSLLSKVYEEIKDGNSLRHMSLACDHWFFYPLILEIEMEKTGAKIWVRESTRMFQNLSFRWQVLVLK